MISPDDTKRFYIDELSVAHMVRLMERGVKIDIRNGVKDMIQYSKTRYEKERFGIGKAEREEEEEDGGKSDAMEWAAGSRPGALLNPLSCVVQSVLEEEFSVLKYLRIFIGESGGVETKNVRTRKSDSNR
ncbi:hypothetical protein NLJ89_g10748 [Agrocybe chaxingu]|uniref:Uncharacterized protein n=1 Tax=Agrocybe chaxingu TaxID=84603 RepID=A0A9W8MSB2_9AGAR|nr:hypothetical protein NLJ89_g10748 [Agrocybe chaxingu]